MEVRARMQEIVLQHRGRYGYRRVSWELRHQGLAVNHKRVLRLMHQDHLLAVRRRKYVLTTEARHDLPVFVNLAGRLQLSGIDQLWVADITFLRLREEFLFLAVVLGRLLAPGGGLGGGRFVARCLDHRRAAQGDCRASAGAGFGASFRSRHSVRCAGLRAAAAGARHRAQHEPHRQPL